MERFELNNIIYSHSALVCFGEFLNKNFPYARVSFFVSSSVGALISPYLQHAKSSGARVDLIELASTAFVCLNDINKLATNIYDNTRLLVAAGDKTTIEAVKLLARIKHIGVVVLPVPDIPIDVLAGYVYVKSGEIFRRLECASPCALFYDEGLVKTTGTQTITNMAADMFIRALLLFDARFACCLGEDVDGFELSALEQTLGAVLMCLKPALLGDELAKTQLVEQAIVCTYHVSNLKVEGSADNIFAAIKQIGKVGEQASAALQLKCVGLLTSLYKRYLMHVNYVPQICDPILRGVLVQTYLGEKHQKTMFESIKNTYKLKEVLLANKDNLLTTITKVERLISRAGDLLTDCQTSLTESEFGVALALAPEMSNKVNMLKILRNDGLTDFAINKAINRLNLAPAV